jgi:hypothetical protein
MLPAHSVLRSALRRAALPLLLGALAIAESGCYFTDEGLEPPGEQFYFPTGLAVSPGRTALYVANSDFDLQYNGGTVQVLDLASIRATLAPILDGLQSGKGAAATCASVGLGVATNQILTPSACTPITPPFKSFATIGAFASGLRLVPNPNTSVGGARLFVPVRGDPSITWFDVADERTASGAKEPFKLDCGQAGVDQRCSDEHRMGIDPYDNFRDLSLPVEPVGLDADDDGKALVSAHQIQGAPAVGLSINDWTSNLRPTFQYYNGTNVANGPTEVARVPKPRLVQNLEGTTTPITYQPGFLVTYNNSPQVDLFRVDFDAASAPPRPFLTRAGSAVISTNADGKDSRGIAIDPSARQACEDSCNDVPHGTVGCQSKNDPTSCLRCCTNVPLDVYIANRAPATLLLGRVNTTVVDSDLAAGTGSGAFDNAVIYDSVPLAQGPSKVGIGKVIGVDGQLHTRVFVVAFDTSFVFSYDPEAQLVDAVIRTSRGPHAIAFDACTTDCGPGEEPHAFLYVGHFTDSYLGVVDLDMRRPTFGTMFASIGTPIEPRESK